MTRAATITLGAGDVRAAVDPRAGARITSLVVGGRERIVGRGDATPHDTTWGIFPMAPWAGRVANARVEAGGHLYALQANLPPHAIHGVVFDAAWDVRASGDAHAVLGCRFDPTRWPLGGGIEQRVRLTPDVLEIEATVTADTEEMPAALGWHPWFARPESGDVRVGVDAGAVLETSDDLIPTGRTQPVDAITDLRAEPTLGDRRLDHVYVHPRSPAVVAWPDLTLEIGFEPPLSMVVVHTPPRGVCVEPQTAWPNAFALDARGIDATGLVHLRPGESLRARTILSWRPSNPRPARS